MEFQPAQTYFLQILISFTTFATKFWEISTFDIFQKALYPSKHFLVLKTYSTRLQRNNFTSFKTSWRRLAKMSWNVLQRRVEDVLKKSWRRLQDVFQKSWKTKNCYAGDVFKMFWRHFLKTSWRHVLKTLWWHVL